MLFNMKSAALCVLVGISFTFCQGSPLTASEGKRLEINGTSYYVAGSGYYSRDWAIEQCRLNNMKPVSFDNGLYEWTTIFNYIKTQVEYPNTVGYWTSAKKVTESSDSWIWETTGEKITDFYWGVGQPSLPENETGVCMMFSLEANGWVNDYCRRTGVGATIVCEDETEHF